ncbi:hypothetical protein, partial [Aeromonas veronii]|uniref:hypothetical protein n=1 Tax=Aeromonas veronii TaxID=654 RepID=UPI00403D66AB
APTPVEPPLPETLVNSVLSISFNTPDCLIVTIGTVCENQDTSLVQVGRQLSLLSFLLIKPSSPTGLIRFPGLLNTVVDKHPEQND